MPLVTLGVSVKQTVHFSFFISVNQLVSACRWNWTTVGDDDVRQKMTVVSKARGSRYSNRRTSPAILNLALPIRVQLRRYRNLY